MLVVLMRILVLLLSQLLQPRRYNVPRRCGVHVRQARSATTRVVRADRRSGEGAIIDGRRGALVARGRGGFALVEGQGRAPEGGGRGGGVGVGAAGGMGALVVHRRRGKAGRVVIRKKSRASRAVSYSDEAEGVRGDERYDEAYS